MLTGKLCTAGMGARGCWVALGADPRGFAPGAEVAVGCRHVPAGLALLAGGWSVCQRMSPVSNPSLCKAALAARPPFAWGIFPLVLMSICAEACLGGTGWLLLINQGGLVMASSGRWQRKGCKCSVGHAGPLPIATSPPFHSPCWCLLPWMQAAEYFILGSSQQLPVKLLALPLWDGAATTAGARARSQKQLWVLPDPGAAAPGVWLLLQPL